MTLAFSTQLNKIPTFFVEKITLGLLQRRLIEYPKFIECVESYYSTFTHYEQPKEHVNPKFHTIRTDEANRWKAGNLIHFVINNRTENRYQFAPIVKCVSTQKVSIRYFYNNKTQQFDTPVVLVDGKKLTKKKIEVLAVNDGFENSKAFFAYFSSNFTGKIIHWTNTKY